jgi:hypothetical protein
MTQVIYTKKKYEPVYFKRCVATHRRLDALYVYIPVAGKACWVPMTAIHVDSEVWDAAKYSKGTLAIDKEWVDRHRWILGE